MNEGNDKFEFNMRPHWPSTWKPDKLLMTGKLTDKKISKYEARGYYSQEVKDARREIQRKKLEKRESRSKRDGSFLIKDGKMIYSPL